MKIAVLKEVVIGERRVAVTPETAKKLVDLGADVHVEQGAGLGASIADDAYRAAGANIRSRENTIDGADVVLVVQGPDPSRMSRVKAGALVVGLLDPLGRPDRAEAYASRDIEAIALELMPRITRAQTMDVLSSQSNLAGYKAILDAAHEYGRAFPMMMTAAGTITAARVFVMGVGVAGLQAIATARRLGALVSATDVRSAVKEQILSLGAKPIFVEGVPDIEAEAGGGYAGEMSAEYRAAQAELMSSHIARQDVVVTTALIPGRPAPLLISDAQVATMKPGSVIVDLAIEQGGNVEGSVAGKVVERHGVILVAHRNVASRVAADASALYARNLSNFLAAFWDRAAGRLVLPEEDEIIKAVRVTRGGRVVCAQLLATTA